MEGGRLQENQNKPETESTNIGGLHRISAGM